jgi:hypothetical protein
LYRNIDIAGIIAVSDVRAATKGKLAVLMASFSVGDTSYFAILVDNSTACIMITINK